MLDKQVNLFSVNTDAFLFDDERAIKTSIREKTEQIQSKIDELEDSDFDTLKELKKELNTFKKDKKQELLDLFANRVLENKKNKNKRIRELDEKYITYIDKNGNAKPNINNIISIFESDLTRSVGVQTNELTYDIMVLEIWYYDLAEDLIVNGFTLNGRRYDYFSSSAGQIRTKKCVFIKSDVYEQIKNKLTCGISIDKINATGGMNANKYLAYLALCNSATSEWKDIFGKEFDIDRCVVVDDFETNVKGKADYIDWETYDIETNKKSEFSIPHVDGAGIILKDYCEKNFMVRMPFFKGLLGSFDFKKFIEFNECSGKITDIWGKEYDVVKDDIQIIFTKSMFKLYKYVSSWDEYKENFKKYRCSACICNIEDNNIKQATINYQMLQTIYDMSSEEVDYICNKSNNKIKRISYSLENMLDIFGVRQNYELNEKDYFKRALKLYPELLKDTSNKDTLRDLKNSLVKKYKSGRLEIQGKFTFVLPDLYAFCEWLFMKDEKPCGLLLDGEVYCDLYRNYDKLDCLRSPSLYLEHPVRRNVCNKKYRNTKLNEWFCTKAIYVSTHDLISRYLQFDVDGDKLLVVADKRFIEMAEKRMEGVSPLYYEMKKANSSILNYQELYNGLKLAFSGGRIGEVSNNITKCWNSGDITENSINTVKWLTMKNNQVIDYAKTLWMPDTPEKQAEIIKSFTRKKVPYFFQYAKDKKPENCEPYTNSTMNNICKNIIDKKIRFDVIKPMGKINYRMFVDETPIIKDKSIFELYKKINGKYGSSLKKLSTKTVGDKILINLIYEQIDELGYSRNTIANALSYYLYKKQTTVKKGLFWILYGDIIYNNLENNLKDAEKYCLKCGARVSDGKLKNHLCDKCRGKSEYKIVKCQDCGVEFEVSKKNNKTVRCKECERKNKLKLNREIKQRIRKTKMSP